eukprot:SAG31_NODE_32924_length_350_cov_0.725100_1_plen_59_part_01
MSGTDNESPTVEAMGVGACAVGVSAGCGHNGFVPPWRPQHASVSETPRYTRIWPAGMRW